jgi:hypothetical protein
MSPSLRLLFAPLLALASGLGCGSSVTNAADAGSPTDVSAVDLPAVDRPAVDRPTVDAPLSDVPLSDVPPADVPPTVRVPLRHRATATTCNAPRPSSTCDPGGVPMSTCVTDGDCGMGTNGRCVGNPHDGCRCSYDRCITDGDCTEGGACECRLPSRGAAGANVCIPGNCRVDADCGPRGFCSPTLGDCGDYGGLSGYYCHTPADECVDDADCRDVDAGFLGQMPYCAYSRQVGHWRCSNQACAG